MAIPDGNSIGDNKLDVVSGLWVDPLGRDRSLGATAGGKRMGAKPVALDGSDPGPNAFEGQGSDANRGRSAAGTSLPPWMG